MNLNAMARALGGEASGGQVLCPGPGHSRKDRSLAVRLTREGRILCHSFAGDDSRVCQEHVRAALGLPSDAWRGNHPQGSHNRHLERLKPRSGDHKDLALSIWRDSGEPRDTLVEKYLASRRLELPQKAAGEVIRFHSACPFRAERFPALICLVRNIRTNEPQAIHRTALAPDGTAIERNGKTFRMTLGPIAGGAIKIDRDEDVTYGLAIGEGVETCLSGWQMGFRPVWSLIDSGGVAKFPILPGIEGIRFFLEHDKKDTNGKAVRLCAGRWFAAGLRPGRDVFITDPAEGFKDLNDELCGVAG
jgi:putative DNA primase/helicase